MMEGKVTGRPGFGGVLGGRFQCHQVEQTDLGFAWERVYYQTPAYNFFQMGAELFPEWQLELERGGEYSVVLGKLQNLRLMERVEFVEYYCNFVLVDDPSPVWVRRVLLNPYKVVLKDTIESLGAGLRALHVATTVLTEKSLTGHKHAHYDSTRMLVQGEMCLPTLNRLMEGAEHSMRKQARKQEMETKRPLEDQIWKPQIPRGHWDHGPLKTEYEKQYATTREAGPIKELPWMLEDARWAWMSPVQRDRYDVAGQTEEGHHLHVNYKEGPHEHSRHQLAYCCNAQAQHVLNCAIYGRDLKNMANLGLAGHVDMEFPSLDWLDDGLEEEFCERSAMGAFARVAEAERKHRSLEERCAEACFHISWLRRRRREKMHAWLHCTPEPYALAQTHCEAEGAQHQWPDDSPSLALQRHRLRREVLCSMPSWCRASERDYRAPAGHDRGAQLSLKREVEQLLAQRRQSCNFTEEAWCTMSADDRRAYLMLTGQAISVGGRYLCYTRTLKGKKSCEKSWNTVLGIREDGVEINTDSKVGQDAGPRQIIPREWLGWQEDSDTSFSSTEEGAQWRPDVADEEEQGVGEASDAARARRHRHKTRFPHRRRGYNYAEERAKIIT